MRRNSARRILRARDLQRDRVLARLFPHALRACKDGYRYALEMTWDGSVSYTLAKENEVFQLQNGGWIKDGVGDFVQGKFKPGT